MGGTGLVFLVVVVAAVLATASSLGLRARPEAGLRDPNPTSRT